MRRRSDILGLCHSKSLQCISLHCTLNILVVVYYATLHFTTLQCTIAHCTSFQCTAMYSLQCTTLQCITQQCTFNILLFTAHYEHCTCFQCTNCSLRCRLQCSTSQKTIAMDRYHSIVWFLIVLKLP